MTKKTKFEKKETAKTAATFTSEEVYNFAAGAYAADRRRLYLEKVSQRPADPRMDSLGRETLSPISMLADVDMAPLTTRQNLARFTKMPSHLEGDGFDADDSDLDDDDSFHTSDRVDNPPSPSELRARRLDKKLSEIRQKAQDDLTERRKKGATPEPDESTKPSTAQPEPEKPSSV